MDDTPANGGDGDVKLSPIQLDGAAQSSNGKLNTTRVSDNRGNLAGWTVAVSLEGNLTDGSDGATANHVIPAGNVTWTQRVQPGTPGVPNVTAGTPGALSATTPSVLCYAATGTGGATYDCDADLSVEVPPSTSAGSYRTTIDVLLY